MPSAPGAAESITPARWRQQIALDKLEGIWQHRVHGQLRMSKPGPAQGQAVWSLSGEADLHDHPGPRH